MGQRTSIFDSRGAARLGGSAETDLNRVQFTLPVAQPFRLDLTALALVRRPNNLVDTWQNGVYRRVVPAQQHGEEHAAQFLLEVAGSSGTRSGRPGARVNDFGRLNGLTNEITVTATGALSEHDLSRAAERTVTHMFGLDVDLAPFEAMARADGSLAPLARRLRGLRPPRYPSLFQSLLNAVPCQQVTLVFGLQLIERLSRAYGPDLAFAPLSSSTGPLPLPQAPALANLSTEQLVGLGLSNTKARTLVGMAQAFTDGTLNAADLAQAPNEAVSSTLQGLYGIGRWTAEYVLLRGLGRLDVYPHGDSGARNSLATFMKQEGKPDYEWVAQAVRQWQPYAGFVYLHLLVAGMLKSGNFGSVPYTTEE